MREDDTHREYSIVRGMTLIERLQFQRMTLQRGEGNLSFGSGMLSGK